MVEMWAHGDNRFSIRAPEHEQVVDGCEAARQRAIALAERLKYAAAESAPPALGGLPYPDLSRAARGGKRATSPSRASVVAARGDGLHFSSPTFEGSVVQNRASAATRRPDREGRVAEAQGWGPPGRHPGRGGRDAREEVPDLQCM